MEQHYSRVIELMLEMGNPLIDLAGKIEDIGVKKAWLTKQDLAIERRFTDLISTFGSNHRIFAEEINNAFVDNENVWIIDPISHTFSFIHGLPHYAVVVTHLFKGKSMFSAVYDPSMKELFQAEAGKGTRLNNQKVEVNKSNTDLSFIYDYQMEAKWFSKEQRLNIVTKLYDLGRAKSLGSAALMYAYVACGRAHACIDINKDPFTTFAGELLVKEAGGMVSDFNGKTVDMNTRGIVASNGVIHKKIIEVCN